MKYFSDFDQLSKAMVLVGTPVTILNPAKVEGVVEAFGNGLTLPSGNVFVPQFDTTEATTGRRTQLIADEFPGNVSASLNRYLKDNNGDWVASPDGRTNAIFYAGQVWWPELEVEYQETDYIVQSWSLSGDTLTVLTTNGLSQPFTRFLGLSQPEPDLVTPISSPRQYGDGTSTAFTSPNSNAAAPENFRVVIDGFVQAPGISYTVAPGQITFTEAPPVNSEIDIVYFYPVTIEGIDGIIPLIHPRHTADGVSREYSTPSTIGASPNSFSITFDGLVQRPVTDYTIDASGNAVFVEVPDVGTQIDITFYNPSTVELDPAADLSFNPVTATGTTAPRTLNDRFSDVVNVKDFGAVGDWNSTSQTGSDDTLAFQSAIDSILTGSRRTGTPKAIYLPKGSYRIDSVAIPQEIGFALQIVGDGYEATTVWNSGTWTCEIEGLLFKDFSAFNILQEDGTEGSWGECFIECARPNKALDVDLVLSGMRIGYSTAWAKVHGRGFSIKGASVGVYCRRILEVVCDPDSVFTGDKNDTLQTGMRHYTFNSLRTDNVRELLGASGLGEQRSYINQIQITDCDLASMQRIINDTNMGCQKMIVNNNIASNAFQNGALNVKRFRGLTMLGNNFSALEDTEQGTLDSTDSIQWLLFTQEGNRDITICNNHIRGLTRGAMRLIGSSDHRNIDFSNNTLDEFATFDDGTNTVVVVDSDANIHGLTLRDNKVYSRVPQNRNYQWQSGANNEYLINSGNISNFDFTDNTYTPILYAGSTPIGTQPSLFHTDYIVSGGYCTVDLVLNADLSAETGTLGFSLPVVAVAEASSVTGGYSGGGSYVDWDGITLPADVTIHGCFVDASSQKVLINTQTLGTTPYLDCNRGSATTRFRLKFRYKV
ncbi:tail protein [Vibrio phage D148]